MRFLLLFALAPLAGCGQSAPPAVAVYPVEGQLIVSGVPAGSAQVAFHPVGDGSAAISVGLTGPDGRFRLTTRITHDGAPAGEYAVTVFWPIDGCSCDDPAHDRLKGAYADRAKSSLRATVRPETNTITIHATVGFGGWNLPRMRDSQTPHQK